MVHSIGWGYEAASIWELGGIVVVEVTWVASSDFVNIGSDDCVEVSSPVVV